MDTWLFLWLFFGGTILFMLVLNTFILLSRRGKENKDEILQALKEQNDELREAVARQLVQGTTEQFARFGVIQESVQATLQRSREESAAQLQGFQAQIEARLTAIGAQLDARLKEMQGIVDEKLQKTLQTRFDQSFEMIRKQLAGVEQGLGEMKNLAADAKSLKNALTNVKDRGTYGEVRLEKLLSDILAPGQYEINAEIGYGKRVEFAVKLPGHGAEPLLLPIDSKFPIEDYNRLLDAQDKPAMDDARRALATKIRLAAKEIAEKYIAPPRTTDFALMFLPTEGLYAEVLQNAALFEELRDKYKITAVGATTLSAFLASLQMGFRTLAIEQRSMEVWDTLRAVKSEFVKFGDMLERARKQLNSADKTLGDIVGTRTNQINRRLRSVEMLEEVQDEGDTGTLYIEDEME